MLGRPLKFCREAAELLNKSNIVEPSCSLLESGDDIVPTEQSRLRFSGSVAWPLAVPSVATVGTS